MTTSLPALAAKVAVAQSGEADVPASVGQGSSEQETAKALPFIHPTVQVWRDTVQATGNVMPWQEISVAAQVGGLRLVSLAVSVGDWVKEGQVLARLDPATVETELDAANAQLAESEAALAQATATLGRGKRLAPLGGVSEQDLTLYETQVHTAEARVNSARAQARRQQLRLDYATLTAPDDGIISATSAAEGSIVQAGSELFRLIRQGRLEWRAELKGETLLRLAPGQEVTVKTPAGTEVKGKVRQVSPTIDVATRNGLAYVDLPKDANLKAGFAVTGLITVGKEESLAVPPSAVLRAGNTAKVLTVSGDATVTATEVKTGRTKDDMVEIVSGVNKETKVIAKASEFLKDAQSSGLPGESNASLK